jgi:acyl-CoA synthetase (AMP-forming)/AMP-acid ligase II
VVLKPNSTTTTDALMQQMRDNLAPYKVPKRIEILPELPISGAGKILKRELQARFSNM